MIKTLQKKTAMEYRDVIRGVSTNVLAATARNTKIAKKEEVIKGVHASIFRKTLKLANGDRVGLTKDGKFWYNKASWTNQNWILVSSSGEIQPAGSAVFRTKNGARVKRQKLSSKTRSSINTAVRMAKQIEKKEIKYRLSTIGLGRRSWIGIMEKLKMKIPTQKKIREVMKVELPSKVRDAISGKEVGKGEKFEIHIATRVVSALNYHAKGLRAFKQAIRGANRTFQRNLEKDLEKYAKKFARQNGFIVK